MKKLEKQALKAKKFIKVKGSKFDVCCAYDGLVRKCRTHCTIFVVYGKYYKPCMRVLN